MRSQASTIEEYLATLSEDRKEAMQSLRKMIKKNLPKGFIEKMGYGMIGYVVPHSIYPPGYHCTPELPLPFMNIASQKNFIAVYHMGIYGDANLLQWFVDEYTTLVGKKPDMGKSCIRFKKPELIPFELFGLLASKISPEKWIEMYEKMLKRK